MKVMELIVVIIFGFIGQMGCWGLMIGGQAVTTLDNALIIHAIGASIAIIGSMYSFERLAPKVAAAAAKGPSQELARLQQLQMRAAKMGLILSIMILLLTGIATAL